MQDATATLIIGDLSGIQDFLLDVRERGGRQAAALRFRSMRLQLLAECIARRVLWALDLPEKKCLLYCVAGKFAIDAMLPESALPRLESVRREIEQWLLTQTHGRLKCAIASSRATGLAATRYVAANADLQRAKLRPWADATWSGRSLTMPDPLDRVHENEIDAKLGRKLLGDLQTVEFSLDATHFDDEAAGVKIRFTRESARPPVRGWSCKSLSDFARHTPRLPGDPSKLVEFVDLAGHEDRAPMLGVLKADADSLGVAFRDRLGDSQTFTPLAEFSSQLDHFFGPYLESQMREPGSRWSNIYTVFAGGDDLLMVGRWDLVIDFAYQIREWFKQEFSDCRLTLSAGCAIVKPKFPIHLGARQADEALHDLAKSGPKDQFAVLGEVWRWDVHARIIGAGKQLAHWVGVDAIERGWLHTILELVLLHRRNTTARDDKIIPEMAASRLCYHVSRNWPKATDPGVKGEARRWIDRVLEHFDKVEATPDPVMAHLPAVIRYAMLATRSKGEE